MLELEFGEKLLLNSQLLLGDEQDHGCSHHHTTDGVEDGGADAAGGGQLGAGVVLDDSGQGAGGGAAGDGLGQAALDDCLQLGELAVAVVCHDLELNGLDALVAVGDDGLDQDIVAIVDALEGELGALVIDGQTVNDHELAVGVGSGVVEVGAVLGSIGGSLSDGLLAGVGALALGDELVQAELSAGQGVSCFS